MTIYVQDFDEYTTGVQPSDWTDRFDTDWTTTTEIATEPSYSGKALKLDPGTTSERRLMSWDDLDSDANRDDIELLVRFRFSNITAPANHFFASVRGSGSAGSETSYNCYLTADDMFIHKWVSGVSTNLDSALGLKVGSAANDNFTLQYNWIRFRVNGTSLKAKFWDEKDSEPEYWYIETTDSAISAAGWNGVGVHNAMSTNYQEVDYFAAGTNGDSPSVPVSASAEISYTRGLIEVARAYTPPAAGVATAPIICINT
jgi:hypothetical protein